MVKEISISEYDVIIIGGGPAGLTAGIYASRARLKTLLVESTAVGGQAIFSDIIENYPGFPEGIKGFELIEKFKSQAENFGTEFTFAKVRDIKANQQLKLFQVETENKIYKTLSIIIAVGVRPKELNVTGESKLRGNGVSYCATCDGPLFKEKAVVVIGGGDTAIGDALFLTRFAKKVILVHRRDQLRATKILQERAFANEKIEFKWNSTVTEILGDKKVNAVNIKNLKTQKETKLPTQGVFIFVGFIPNTDFLMGKDIVELNKEGYVITDENMKTSLEGIFACGDCRQKLLRQIVTACGDGATAAFSAQQYVEQINPVRNL